MANITTGISRADNAFGGSRDDRSRHLGRHLGLMARLNTIVRAAGRQLRDVERTRAALLSRRYRVVRAA